MQHALGSGILSTGRRRRRPALAPQARSCLSASACRKKKSFASKLFGARSTTVVVGLLLLVACFGWLHTHKHKKALHESLGDTVGKMNTATRDRGASLFAFRGLVVCAMCSHPAMWCV